MKRILITGGSRGIGAQCVRLLTSVGNDVTFIYNKSNIEANALVRETGATGICTDISQSESAISATRRAIESMGGIDVLINNAAISQIKLFTEISDSDWQKMCDTNLSSCFYITRTAAEYMIRSQSGNIINIGSIWGRVGASCEVHYSTLKSALRGFTRSLAKELGPSGIRVNCIEPGVIDTEMNSLLDNNIKAELVDSTPLCRLGSTENVADLVEFLVSDKSSFITGQIIGVDGGFGI